MKIVLSFALFVLFGLIQSVAQAQSPGTILFSKGSEKGSPSCYFKAGEESRAPLTKSMGVSDDVCFRVYATQPLGGNPRINLYVDGSLYKWNYGQFGWPDRTTGFWNLKGVLGMAGNQHLPRGRHCVKVDQKYGGRPVVIAEGCYTMN